jgi:hypothetical protein
MLLPIFRSVDRHLKNKRTSVPFGVSLFLPRFELDERKRKELIKRVECASDEPSAIARVVEEIKWQPAEIANL